MTLPKLNLTLRETNPEFVAVFEEGNNRAINMDEYQKDYEIEVEVVQLNLNSGGMRVRYPWPNKHRKNGVEMVSRDVSISAFFDRYELVDKTT